jgi:PII-like signaling protein
VSDPGRLLELHMAESDRYEGKPLFEAIVAKCRELSVSGVTVFRGLEGYGPTSEMHRARLVGKDQPIIIVIADKAEIVDNAIPALGDIMGGGLMAVSEIRMKRVQKGTE